MEWSGRRWEGQGEVSFGSQHEGGACPGLLNEQHSKLTLNVTTLDDQPSASIDGSTGSQLGEEELDDVLGLTVHTLADVGHVGEDGTLVALAEELRRGNGVLFLAGGARKGRVGGVEKSKEAAEELWSRQD